MLAVVRIGKHLPEVARHRGTVVVQLFEQSLETAKAHGPCDAPAIIRIGRQAVGLGIVEILQPMLQAAQEIVGGHKLDGGIEAENAALGQQLQHFLRRLDLQRCIAPAANQLEHLGDELDLAYAAGTEFDVVGHVLLRHLAANLRVQFAHRVDGAEIEILAEYEGMPDLLQFIVAASGQRPRLDPCVALPFTALCDEIVLQHFEGTHQRAGIAIRPQAHVDAKHLAVFRNIGNGIDQASPEPGEKFEIRYRTRICVYRIRIAILGKHENQVDVGRYVQLASAQLAHAEDNEFLRPSVSAARRAVALDQAGAEHLHRLAHRQFGDQGHALRHLGERRKAGQVASRDAGVGPLLELPQHGLQVGLGHRLRGEPGEQFRSRDRLRQGSCNFSRQGRPGGQQAPEVTGCFRDIGERGHRLEFKG
jgi:hypothetical protein